MTESKKSLNQIIKFRLDKLNKVYDHGVDPYPQKFEPKHKGATLIINPPYGERIGEEDSINYLYELIRNLFKNKCIDFNCFVFTANLDAVKNIGLKASQKIVLKNGNLDSRLLSYPIQKGTYIKKGSK